METNEEVLTRGRPRRRRSGTKRAGLVLAVISVLVTSYALPAFAREAAGRKPASLVCLRAGQAMAARLFWTFKVDDAFSAYEDLLGTSNLDTPEELLATLLGRAKRLDQKQLPDYQDRVSACEQRKPPPDRSKESPCRSWVDAGQALMPEHESIRSNLRQFVLNPAASPDDLARQVEQFIDKELATEFSALLINCIRRNPGAGALPNH